MGAFLGFALTSLSSCSSVSYYRQAIAGQLEITRLQEPIERILEENAVASDRAQKLKLVQDLRVFAEGHLALPAGRNYSNYADLGREHTLWSVFAAPEFSLEPKTWSYPVVGELEYRGYFREKAARDYADNLRAEGFDVLVAEVDAYSTLGWFADPVLNTFVDYDDYELAELIFHELTHRRVYRAGETAFNEALATAVAQEGVVRWLQATGRTSMLGSYRSRLNRIDRIYAEIAHTRRKLEFLYSRSIPAGTMRKEKRRELRQFQNRLKELFAGWHGRVPDSWIVELPNNARLNASATYQEHVPLFEHHLNSVCGGDLERFLEEMEEVDVEEFVSK